MEQQQDDQHQARDRLVHSAEVRHKTIILDAHQKCSEKWRGRTDCKRFVNPVWPSGHCYWLSQWRPPSPLEIKKPPKNRGLKSGAGEEGRTPDLMLGKHTL
jgi:hypothetical protein